MPLWDKVLKLYHGSPHSFSEFKKAPEATGWGVQKYGVGNYLAGNPETAVELYAKVLAGRANYESTKARAKAQKINRGLEDKARKQAVLELLAQDYSQYPTRIRQLAAQGLVPISKWDQPLESQVDEARRLAAGNFGRYIGGGPPEELERLIQNAAKGQQLGSPEHISALQKVKDSDQAWYRYDYGTQKALYSHYTAALDSARKLSPLERILAEAEKYRNAKYEVPQAVEVPPASGPKTHPYLYTVDFRAAPDEIIPLDVPFYQQEKEMLDRLAPLLPSNNELESPLMAMRRVGMTPELSKSLRDQGLKGGIYNPSFASQFEHSRYIPDDRDAFFRALEKEDYSPFNFVVYDPVDLTIVEKKRLK